jgi:hypothetical protein
LLEVSQPFELSEDIRATRGGGRDRLRARLPGEDLLDALEDALGHVQLLPRADGGGHRERPQDEQADRADRRLVDPAAGADLDDQLLSLKAQNHVQGRGHAGELPPAALLLDLQQRRAVLGAQLLRAEPFADEPAVQLPHEASEIDPGCRKRMDEVAVRGTRRRGRRLDDGDRLDRRRSDRGDGGLRGRGGFAPNGRASGGPSRRRLRLDGDHVEDRLRGRGPRGRSRRLRGRDVVHGDDVQRPGVE